ncbi:YhjD/YihY/BrkB family envelope integrity protein [Seleniivibrio sp.]|uniref:YhjD/YihY/BrkB family envelope integrity protein n=1 Tax=Seleniivibrio sp. TaxID=2898801 RepID=UPI0025D2B393|nr:YhjD/YihY/BrkB family envelope integrity protein [Seleniivibrio sp.]MCD8554556.1 YihY/virulence factor BrkB family protein [Seleniivibrio sp.]
MSGFYRTLERHVLSFFQRLTLSYSYYISNELRNHAAAAAYYMLLSLIPLVLFLFYIFDTFLSKYPNFSEELFYLLYTFNENISPKMFRDLGISGSAGSALGILGLLNLVWSSRLILVSIQRAFFVIFPSENKRNFVMENFIAFIILPVVFALVLLLAVFSGLKGLIIEYLTFFNMTGTLVVQGISIASSVVAVMMSFMLVFASFKYIPVKKPDNKSAAKGAVLFIVLYGAVKFAAFGMFHLFSVSTAYGIVGSVIVILVWAYFVFMIYLYCAQFVFVCYRADILILNKLFSYEKPSPMFMRMNSHLLSKFTRKLKEGETLFHEGDKSYDVYYIKEGRMRIIIDGRLVGTVGEGEIFGEMAHITQEARSATLQADRDTELLVLSPYEFDEIMKDSYVLSRRVMSTLCGRLKQTDAALSRLNTEE